jgi:predicted transcriptional regulator of viral defense system
VPKTSTIAALADLVEDQWGLFTRRQAEDTGLAWTTLARLAKSGIATRVAHGVYRLRGTPADDLADVHAAWLQLAPGTPAWERSPSQGVVSHRSAAEILGFGHLPADTHQFTVPTRRQTRRHDVHLYRAPVADGEWLNHRGLLITRPSRTVADLLRDKEDPGAVAQVVADCLRAGKEVPSSLAAAISPHAVAFGFDRGDGASLLDWLLDIAGFPPHSDLAV